MTKIQELAQATLELLKRHEEDLDALGLRVERELVVPLCTTYGFSFSSGMGTFFFQKGSQRFATTEDVLESTLPTRQKLRLVEVLAILDREVAHGNYVGYYVSDVPAPKTLPERTPTPAQWTLLELVRDFSGEGGEGWAEIELQYAYRRVADTAPPGFAESAIRRVTDACARAGWLRPLADGPVLTEAGRAALSV